MYPITLQDSFDHFYPPTGHVRPWDFVQPWYFCHYLMKCESDTHIFIIICNSYPVMICELTFIFLSSFNDMLPDKMSRHEIWNWSWFFSYQSSPQPKLLYSMHQNTQRHVSINLKRQLWSLLHSSRPCPKFSEISWQDIWKKAESRSVETIYTDLRCFRLLQTLVLKFLMVLKHTNCLLNVIIENFLKSHGRT